jgi:hypothetical protein
MVDYQAAGGMPLIIGQKFGHQLYDWTGPKVASNNLGGSVTRSWSSASQNFEATGPGVDRKQPRARRLPAKPPASDVSS